MNYFAHPDHLAFTWKGRVALYAILKALGVEPGDEVVVPGFTCVVVPSAVMSLGAIPIYADIDPDTYTSTAETIKPCVTKRTRVIIAQNTFGLSAEMDSILALARRIQAFVVEDAAHGLGAQYRGRPAGATADATFYSTQWSKPISTGLGGIAYSPDRRLAGEIQSIVRKMTRCPTATMWNLSLQRLVRPLADRPQLHYFLIHSYRWLTQHMGWLPGSSAAGELVQTTMRADFCRQMGAQQRHLFFRGIAQLPAIVDQRCEIAGCFDELLTQHGLRPPMRPSYATHAMLRYAFRVGNKPEVMAAARRHRIPLGDWFSSPLHPLTGDLGPWNYRSGQCPVAEQACREIVNLYTHARLYRNRDPLKKLLQLAQPAQVAQRTAA